MGYDIKWGFVNGYGFPDETQFRRPGTCDSEFKFKSRLTQPWSLCSGSESPSRLAPRNVHWQNAASSPRAPLSRVTATESAGATRLSFDRAVTDDYHNDRDHGSQASEWPGHSIDSRLRHPGPATVTSHGRRS